MTSGPDHYFSADPESRSRERQIRVELGAGPVELVTDRGTFSPKRIDPGTAFLLAEAPEPPEAGRFLDIGCGYGPLALRMATMRPDAEVIAIDVNERSRDLCRRNAEQLGCANVTVADPDDVEPGLQFDLIWSNPPIRIGKDALHALLLRWLARLTDDGTAVLVVGRNLGADSLQAWLGTQGFPTARLGSRKGYRLLEVKRAGPTD